MAAQVQLTDSQREAVEYPWRRKIAMVLSTAGSGKTLVLSRRAIHIAKQLVSEGDFDARLLCVCYNRNAADEMRDRIAISLCEAGLAEHVYVSRDSSRVPNMITIEVRTFHALGFYILKSSYVNQRGYVNLDGRPIYALTGASLRTKYFQALQVGGILSGADTEARKRGYLSKLLNQLAREKGVQFDRVCGDLLRTGCLENQDSFQKVEFEIYEKMLSENNAVDYSDMLRKTVLLLYHSQSMMNRVSSRYVSVLVDEFQDMCASQVYLCKALVNQTDSLTLVGDDDQQIYSFRTGMGWCCHDVLKASFSDIETLTLNENHRCTGAVVKAAYAVINNNTNRVPKEIKAVRGTGMPVQVVGCKNQQLEMDLVVRRVKALLPIARKNGHRIILLFRRNNLLHEFQKRFSRERIRTTRKATAPRYSKPIGPLTLRTFALMSLLNSNITVRGFLWATTTVSPCMEESFIRNVLQRQDDAIEGNDTAGLGFCNEKGERDHKKNFQDLNKSSSLLGKFRYWHDQNIASPEEEDKGTVEIVEELLSVVDALGLKSKEAGRLEDLVQHAATLLTCSPGTSETTLSSQNAINYEPERHGSSYGSEDPDGEGLDSESFDILVSAARTLDEETLVQKSEDIEENNSYPQMDTEKQDSDDEDFAQMFCRDRDVRTAKRRKAAGINAVSIEQRSILVADDMRQRQLEKLYQRVCYKFKTIDKKWLSREPNSDALTVLSTAHGAKGCTFAYVFLCGADDNAFPVGGNSGMCPNAVLSFLGVGGDFELSGASANDGQYQEERRLFFVALTRTVVQFTCTYSSYGVGLHTGDGRSPFIQEMLEGLGWDPRYVTESHVRCFEDVEKVSQQISLMSTKVESKVEAKAEKPHTQVKEEQEIPSKVQ